MQQKGIRLDTVSMTEYMLTTVKKTVKNKERHFYSSINPTSFFSQSLSAPIILFRSHKRHALRAHERTLSPELLFFSLNFIFSSNEEIQMKILRMVMTSFAIQPFPFFLLNHRVFCLFARPLPHFSFCSATAFSLLFINRINSFYCAH